VSDTQKPERLEWSWRNFGLFCLLYIALGLFLERSWWFDTLVRGGLLAVLYQGIFKYWYLNLLGFGAAAALAILVSRQPDSRLSAFSRHRWTIPGILVIIAYLGLPLFRAWTLGPKFHSPLGVFTDVSQGSVEAPTEEEPASVVSAPVDIVFIDAPKIEDFYSQFREELRLAAATMTSEEASEVEGGLKGASLPVEATASGKRSHAQAMSYEAMDTSTERKLIDLVNYLAESDQLLVLGSISEVSERYRRFTELTTALEESYGVSVDQAQAAEAYRSITVEEVNRRLDERIAVNRWVLVAGSFRLHEAAEGGNLVFAFSYIPEAPDLVVFETPPVPVDQERTFLTVDQTWSLRVIGKILRRAEGESERKYLLRPYAIFR